MKLHIFGTCSGTEPFPKRHHTSFAFDHEGALYWFDAGECCSYTAYLMGIDILRTRKICISHTHMDHIGGLANLFWTIRKLDTMNHNLQNRKLELFIPELGAWKAIESMLRFTEGNFRCDFVIDAHEYTDGLLFEENNLRVSALHNNHLAREADAPWRSFGFSVEAKKKRIVYTGDTYGIDDFYPLMPCDLLLIETGHHHPVELVRELIRRDMVPETLAFIHHGRDILNHYDCQERALKELLGNKFVILEDAVTVEV
jgi:ribonuclease BN (tRNA processing enzyme)